MNQKENTKYDHKYECWVLMVTTHASCTRLFLLCTNKAPDASSGVTKVAPSENDTSPMVINVATGRAGVSYGRVRWLMVALSGDYAPTQHGSQEHPSCLAGRIHQADPERHQPASTVWSSMTDGAPVWCSPVHCIRWCTWWCIRPHCRCTNAHRLTRSTGFFHSIS